MKARAKKPSAPVKDKPVITVVGAGLAGAFLAVVLAKRGYTVHVYERYSEQDTLDRSSRRSFNITFYGYGVTALKEAGIWDQVEPILLPMDGSATQVSPTGKYIYSHFEKGDMPYYAVSRAGMLRALVTAARREPLVTFHFSTPIKAIDRDARTMTIEDTKTKKTKTVRTDVIIGADGVNSAVRASIQTDQAAHSKVYADWIYRQIAFSPEVIEKLGMKTKMAYSWTRKHAAIVGFPQLDGIFGALLMLPKDSERGFESVQTAEDVKKLISEQFPALMPALETITREILTNPDGTFVTIRTSPWYYQDSLAIIGDAAHGFLPFYGMGTATAFGDCLELAHLLDQYGPRWDMIFPLYQEARKKNTDVIADLSNDALLRFTRSTKADPGAIYDRLETLLSNWFPKWFLPSMFYSVAHEPNRSAEYKVAHDKQRKRNQYIGVGLVVSIITIGFALLERLQSRKK